MAHQLSFAANGQAEMAYMGQTPWHGLGQKVSAGASLEEWMVQANLEWNILQSPVMYMNGSMHEAPEYQVLYRSDTNAHLSVVSDRYKVVQPKEMLEFFRSLVDAEGFSIDTVGSLKGGRRMWALANTNVEDEVNNGESFANLRQIFHSMILAKWYEQHFKNSILGQNYVDKNVTNGIDLDDKSSEFSSLPVFFSSNKSNFSKLNQQ